MAGVLSTDRIVGTLSKESATGPDAPSRDSLCSPRSQRRRLPNRLLLASGLGVILVVWFFREPLQTRIARSVTLANPAPPPEVVEEMIEKSPDRTAAILAAWHSGKIVHRQVAVRQISRATTPEKTLPSKLDRFSFPLRSMWTWTFAKPLSAFSIR